MKIRVQHGKVVFGEYVWGRDWWGQLRKQFRSPYCFYTYKTKFTAGDQECIEETQIHSWIQCHHRVGSVITDTPFGNMDGRCFPFMYILRWFSSFIPYLIPCGIWAADLQLSYAAIRNWFQFARCSVAVHLWGTVSGYLRKHFKSESQESKKSRDRSR
jgi:hypothetical protein